MRKAKKLISLLLCLSLIMSGMSFSFAADTGAGSATKNAYMQEIVEKLGEELDAEQMMDYLSYVYLGWRTTGGPWQNQVIDDFARGELVDAGYKDAGAGTSDQNNKSANDKSSVHDDDYVWTTYFNDISSLTWSPEYAKLEISTEAEFEGKDKLIDRVNVESYAFDPTCDTYQEYYSDLYGIKDAESDDAWIDGMWDWITSKDKDGNRLYVNKEDPQAGEEAKLQKRVHLAWNSCFTDDRGTDPKDAKGVTGEVVYVGKVSRSGSGYVASEVADLSTLAGKVLLSDSSLSNTFNLAKQVGAVAVASKSSLSNYSQPKDVKTGEWIEPFYDSARYASGASLSSTKAQTESGAPIVEWQFSNNQFDALKELVQKADKPVMAKNIAIGTAYAMNDEAYGGKGQAITVAEIKGSTKPDERVFLCAHVQEPGSNDNATGVATLLGMATAYKEMIDAGKIERPERTITFMWGDEMSMATLYMSSHKAEKENLITVLDLDMTGEDPEKTGGVMRIEKTPDPSAKYNYTLDTLPWEDESYLDETFADPDGNFTRLPDSHTLWGAGSFDGMFQEGFYLNDLYMYATQNVIEHHDDEFQVDVCPYEGGSDHSRFLAQGVPAMLTWHFTDYTYHTSVDTLAMSSGREMENVGITSLAAAILNADVIDENEAYAFEMLEMVRQAALDRMANEMKNTDNHKVYADAHGDVTALADEKEVLNAWADWYDEAIESVAGLLDKPSDAYKTAEAAAKADLEVARKAAIAHAEEVFPPVELEIANVEELVGGETQVLYRNEVYKGVEANGEDPDKYYTTYREINLKDQRVFNFEFDVDAKTVGADPEAFLKKVDLTYGGLDLEEWVWDGFNSNVKPIKDPVIAVKDKAIEKNADGSYTVKVAMETKATWAPSKQNATNNIPYDNYVAGRQFDFSTGQSADNRAWWQAGPLGTGVGTYEMALTIDDKAAATTDIHIGPYDGAYSWIEMNEYAQNLIKAINGEEYPKELLDGHTIPDGPIAAGYVAMDDEGNFVKGTAKDNVYVEVSVIGFGLTDNYKEENKKFNNYSQYNAIWNIAVAMDEETVDEYLNETVPAMNENPQEIIDKIKDQKDEDIDLMQVYYQNNVHSDEVTGTDTIIKLVNDLIDGGKAGKDIAYKTWELEDMDLKYRDPAKGYAQGESGHIVKGGYAEDGIFMDPEARTDKTFNTKEALENFIFVQNLTNNPDGKAGMRRTNRYAFDLNRDAVFSTMPETIAIGKDLMKWDPLVMNEWHGYVTQMLIESCTAPHDPAYDYDLLQNNMLNLTYAAGQAVTASTGMQRFLVPWDHYDGGDWDDGGTIYAPMFAMLLGCYGYTIEFPYSNLDSMDAGNVINYAMVNELLHGKTDFFPGNRLNGELEGVDGEKYASHEEDIKYYSFRKASLISKLETKVRGINNIDAKETVDKYFIDKKNDGTGKMVDKVVGRARPVDKDGNELSFFPDYIVIPTDEANQYNVAEGMKAIKQMLDWKIDVSISNKAVTYDGKEIPAGAYVLDLKQSRRNVIFEAMGKGYDATGFSSMYADIYCNLPDVRGFDSIQIYSDGLFDGKVDPVTSVEKKADITGAAAEYVVFKSQSTDAVRFVNLLLSGTSSGGSVSEKADVWMLREAVDGVGNASDYIIKAADLAKIENLKDNPVINLVGCHIEGKYIDKLPAEAVQLVEPVIQWNTTRTAQTGGALWYLLDDYLGFGSLKDYNGSSTLREGANVIIANNQSSLNAGIVDAVKDGTGIIFIRNANGLAQLDDSITAPGRGSFTDVAINGQYNVDDSLYTENYAATTTYYARGYKYTNVPEEAKILFKSDKEGAFIGGFQNTKGQKDVFNDATTMFSLILNEGDNPAQALVIGQQMDNRSHYQKLLPLLATAIYANAAGILDDFNDPIVDKVYLEDGASVVRAADADSGVSESGVKSVAVYEGDKKVGEGKSEAKFDGKDGAAYKVVITDYAGNVTETEITLDIDKMDMQGQIIALEKALEEAKEISEADKAALEAEIAALEKALADANTENAKDKAALEAQIAELAKALADSESVNAETKAALEARIEALEKALAEEAAANDSEKAELEKQIAELEAELKASGDASAAEKAALEAKIAELQAQIDELSKEPVVVKLDAPANVKAQNLAKSGKIKITWDAVDGADEYVVYRATSKDGSYKKMFITTGTSYTNTNAVAGKAYWYKVKAVSDDKAVNNSAFSKVVSRTCDYARPVVSAKATDGKVVLTWKKVEGATKYYVYKATSKDGEYKCIGSTTNLKFTNKSGLKSGKTYYYKVKAVGKKNAASAYSVVDACKIK